MGQLQGKEEEPGERWKEKQFQSPDYFPHSWSQGGCSNEVTREPRTGQDNSSHGDPAVEVHGGVKGHVAVEEGLPQEGDEVAAHGEQDVGEHEGDAGGRAPRQDDAHKGGLGDARGWRVEGIV